MLRRDKSHPVCIQEITEQLCVFRISQTYGVGNLKRGFRPIKDGGTHLLGVVTGAIVQPVWLLGMLIEGEGPELSRTVVPRRQASVRTEAA